MSFRGLDFWQRCSLGFRSSGMWTLVLDEWFPAFRKVNSAYIFNNQAFLLEYLPVEDENPKFIRNVRTPHPRTDHYIPADLNPQVISFLVITSTPSLLVMHCWQWLKEPSSSRSVSLGHKRCRNAPHSSPWKIVSEYLIGPFSFFSAQQNTTTDNVAWLVCVWLFRAR